MCRNSLSVKIESGDKAIIGNAWASTLLVSVDKNPYDLVERAISQAAFYSGKGKSLHEKKLPKSLDFFGWCSWDAFYSTVSASGIFSGVESLQSGGTPPKFVIIDDGWQQTDLDTFPGNSSLDESERSFSNNLSISNMHGEAFLEAESRALKRAVKDMNEGSSAGAAFQELIEASKTGSSINLHVLALEHERKQLQVAKTYESMMPRLRHKLVCGIESALGYLMGIFQMIFLFYYEKFVDPAVNGSWYVEFEIVYAIVTLGYEMCLKITFRDDECRTFRFFSKLAHGPLRNQILQFIADQTNFSRRITDVFANAKFSLEQPSVNSPNVSEDLKGVVGHLKSKLHVDYVICWHGISAYWSGVSIESTKMKKYSPHNVHPEPMESLLDVEPSMKWNPTVLAGMGSVYDPHHLYQDMHRYLKECGVSGVKVDCQAGINLVGSVGGGGASIAARYHDALELSTSKNFETNTVINCMCHTIENIYHWKTTAVARASDDFYPSDNASHYAHIVACAYNGLFLSPLVIPDYDMFQSNHSASMAHAVARAVSGGPVYVSDKPGKHDFSVLQKLVLPNGRVLRAKLPARPTLDCIFTDVTSDGKTALKLWTLNHFSAVMGVFHVQGSSWSRDRRRFLVHKSSPAPILTSLSPSDIPLFAKQTAKDYLLTFEIQGDIFWDRLELNDATEIELKSGEALAIHIAPIFNWKREFCPIGLQGMLNSGGAILGMKVRDNQEWTDIEDIMSDQLSDVSHKDITEIWVQICGCGTFLAYSDVSPITCTVDNIESGFSWNTNGRLQVPLPHSHSGDLDCSDEIVHAISFTFR